MVKVCIVGSGYLGTQIGALSARSGYSVTLFDIKDEAFSVSKSSVREYIDEWVEGEVIKPEQDEEIVRKISYTTDLAEAVRDSEIVIEAVVENLDVKRKVFKQLDELCDPSVILCSNSSSIKISLIEDATSILNGY